MVGGGEREEREREEKVETENEREGNDKSMFVCSVGYTTAQHSNVVHTREHLCGGASEGAGEREREGAKGGDRRYLALPNTPELSGGLG